MAFDSYGIAAGEVPVYSITAEETSGNPSGGLVVEFFVRNFDQTAHPSEEALFDDVTALVEALPNVNVLSTSKSQVVNTAL